MCKAAERFVLLLLCLLYEDHIIHLELGAKEAKTAAM